VTAPFLRRTTLARALVGVFLSFSCALLTGCGSPTEEPSAPETPEATAPPFAVKLDAPDNAAVGDEVTVTLTNVGRLPDAYQLVAEPLNGARIPEPNQHASPGESVEVTVRLNQLPVSIVVKSVGGGGGNQVGQVTIN
jgi:hypothetical protein